MSRLLRINDIDVDIDEKTAIGLDLQSYDVKEPGKTFINVSNTFNVPVTSSNLAIFGLINDPQSKSTKVYDIAICNYWIDNEKIIDNAKIRVENIQDRINLFIYEKQNFWEDIKKDLWPDFVDELIIWLNTEKGLPIETDPFTGDPFDFLDSYFEATEGVILPYYIGNFGDYKTVGQKTIEYQTVDSDPSGAPTIDVVITSDHIIGSPGTISFTFPLGTTAEELAQLIADELNANNSVSQYYEATAEDNKTTITSNDSILDVSINLAYFSPSIPDKPNSTQVQFGLNADNETLERTYDDPFISGQIYLKQKNLDEDGIGGHFCIYARTIFEFIEYKYDINLLVSGGVMPGNIWDDIVAQKLFTPVKDLSVFMSASESYFEIDRVTPFLPLTDQQDKADKKVYDFVVSFMNHLNIIKDEFIISGENTIRFARFDDLETIADVVDFSGKTSGTPNFRPRVNGYAQENIIKFKEIYPEGDELINSKTLTCLNLNLDITANLIEIDAYVPSVIISNGESISNAIDKESFTTFTWYVSNEYTDLSINVIYSDIGEFPLSFYAESRTMQIAKLYDLSGEYNFLDEIVDYPKVYDLDKWMTIADIRNFEFFKQYYIRKLNGSFFVNKITGFNPEKSKKPTTLNLIKISDRTPISPPDANPWVDGVQSIWEDGEFDYWY